MKMRMRAISMVAIAVLLAACGGDGSTPATGGNGAGDGAAGTPTNTITLADNQFTPSAVTISSSEITLVNSGSALHNVSVNGQSIDHDVPAGETETEDFELAAGTYTIFCKYHREQGMEGTLTVT